MTQPGTRDRRPLFGGPSSSAAEPGVDVESLERENDKGIDSLGDKTSILRQLTAGIKAEVDSQHRLVDGLGDAMGGAQVGLAAAASRFKRTFNDPRKNRTFMIAGAIVVVVFIVYLLVTRRT